MGTNHSIFHSIALSRVLYWILRTSLKVRWDLPIRNIFRNYALFVGKVVIRDHNQENLGFIKLCPICLFVWCVCELAFLFLLISSLFPFRYHTFCTSFICPHATLLILSQLLLFILHSPCSIFILTFTLIIHSTNDSYLL